MRRLAGSNGATVRTVYPTGGEIVIHGKPLSHGERIREFVHSQSPYADAHAIGDHRAHQVTAVTAV
ncbi:hypothetical protein [Burkholderia pyrrocinia]|uniref:hypothetical protein n=1 Tax=Burkholderia pyrrocinia TaxID=60550 RepID=UPI00158B0495|nr:hypothetical protein [Burkholderia pyrrocinia]